MDRPRTGPVHHEAQGLGHEFRLAMRQTAATVCAVSTIGADGEWRGATVSSMTSVSLSPPALLVSLATTSRIHAAVLSARRFVVTIFAEHHREIAACFANPRRHPERFAEGPWVIGEAGLPVLPDAVANIVCKAAGSLPFATHTIIVGEVESITRDASREPLVYHDGRYGSWRELEEG